MRPEEYFYSMSEAEMCVEVFIVLVMELQEQNARLAAENAELKRRLEEKERSSKRQVTPFSKGEKQENPKKPGRKSGKGKFSRRDPPPKGELTHRAQMPLAGDVVSNTNPRFTGSLEEGYFTGGRCSMMKQCEHGLAFNFPVGTPAVAVQ
jgi:hypothetical protein